MYRKKLTSLIIGVKYTDKMCKIKKWSVNVDLIRFRIIKDKNLCQVWNRNLNSNKVESVVCHKYFFTSDPRVHHLAFRIR